MPELKALSALSALTQHIKRTDREWLRLAMKAGFFELKEHHIRIEIEKMEKDSQS